MKERGREEGKERSHQQGFSVKFLLCGGSLAAMF